MSTKISSRAKTVRRAIELRRAAQIHRHRFRPIRHAPARERLRTARRAEFMIDVVRVEIVLRHRAFIGGDGERIRRREPEDEALALTVRAIALNRLIRRDLGAKRDLPAVTTTFNSHE